MVEGDGAITGLSSFICRAYRSTVTTNTTDTQRIVPMTGIHEIMSATVNSVDDPHDHHGYHDCHNQLKGIHSVDTGGQESYSGSGSPPLPQPPSALQQQLQYQQWVSTGIFVCYIV